MQMKRYMKKFGDWRDCYEVGKNVVFKWNITYRILKVTYNAEKNITIVILEKAK